MGTATVGVVGAERNVGSGHAPDQDVPMGMMVTRGIEPELQQIGRYVLHPAIARGGMATVHAARLVAAGGITRLVAAKRLHPHLTDDPEFLAMFHDEARIASRIHHPNVVPVLDVVCEGDEVILVQEYVHGVPLSPLFKAAMEDKPIPISIAAAIVAGVLAGLHASHEATDELGQPLEVVHRDVSPQNVLVSVDGIPRLVDFGIAKATSSVHQTREGFLKGKLAYMSPEQIRTERATRQADIYAAGAMLWELLVNRRFYDGRNDVEFMRAVAGGVAPRIVDVLEAERTALGRRRWEAITKLDPIVARALAPNLKDRYRTALEMIASLGVAVPLASAAEIAAWVKSAGAVHLARRRQILAENEATWRASLAKQKAADTFVPERESDDDRPSGPRLLFRSPAARDRDLDETISEARATRLTAAQPEKNTRSVGASIASWLGGLSVLGAVGGFLGMILVHEPPPSGPPLAMTTPIAAALPASPPPAAALPSSSPAPAPAPPADVSAAPPVIPSAVPAAAPSARPQPPPRFTPRWSPPPRPVAPTWQPRPSSAPTRADCTPPFYFEGMKKVFKPGCL